VVPGLCPCVVLGSPSFLRQEPKRMEETCIAEQYGTGAYFQKSNSRCKIQEEDGASR